MDFRARKRGMEILFQPTVFNESTPAQAAHGAIVKELILGSILLVVFVTAWGISVWTPEGTVPKANAASSENPSAAQFIVEPCSTPVRGGKASLVIGALQGKATNYVGNYDLRVFPYFFMNETGSFSMTLSGEAVEKLDKGLTVAATGQAVTKKNGKTRKVIATLTPTGKDAGTVSFSFTGEDTKLTFNSTYKRVGR